ncbi:MAG: DUF72 domain-containing protein [Steroidobacter sp.]
MNFTGTAGWSVPRAVAKNFPGTGTHLQRYAQVLNGVEINSSFYRAHAVSTYQRWADSTPSTFRFAVKVPRAITHKAGLRCAREDLQQFLTEVNGLGNRLGPLLIQLPPSMKFDAKVVSHFLRMLRDLYQGTAVCEPRHKSWFEQPAESLLIGHNISRVAADPPVAATGEKPGGDTQLVYYRLHGSPRTYWSGYSQERLIAWVNEIRLHGNKTVWIIFDNTAAGYATSNALQMRELLK